MIFGQWMGNFKIERAAVKWVSSCNAEAFRKFENGTAEDFIAQILAEVSATQ